MKTHFNILLSSIVSLASFSQNHGTVSYSEKIQLELRPDDPAVSMLDSLPKEQTTGMVLFFTDSASLYQPDKNSKGSGDIDKEENGSHLVIKMDRPQNQIYRDLKNKILIQQREFMGRKFLIESDGGKSDWKLTGNQKTILGYACQEATRQDKDRKIRVWFTPSIPVPTGPGTAANLPGLILEEEINGGKIIVTATKIDQKPVDKSMLPKPKDGKKMTQEAFEKMVDAKMKEMNQDGGGGNQRQVIIRTK
jgi:GLPGLI family protein